VLKRQVNELERSAVELKAQNKELRHKVDTNLKKIKENESELKTDMKLIENLQTEIRALKDKEQVNIGEIHDLEMVLKDVKQVHESVTA
jgi:chromosome segregation ATPase